MPEEDAIGESASSKQVSGARSVPTALQYAGMFAGRYRWVICGVLLLGVTKNYMDRGVLGVLNITLQHRFGWGEIHYSKLVVAFQAAYAVGLLLTGRIIDRLGTRTGYALAMAFWSFASMCTAIGSSLTSFAICRVALGFGEAAVFPASIKA